MKDNLKIIIIALALIIIGIFIYYYKTKPASIINEGTPIVTEDSIKGCYIARLAKDVFTLSINREQGESFEGNLDIKNFEKDSSTGTLKGTYKNGILLADYIFQSEGIESVGQVAFKKFENDFVRGYGKPDDATGTRFVDLNKITYDQSVVYQKVSAEKCPVPPNTMVDIKQNVENYLRQNISKLSPIKAVLGGTWYVVSVMTNLEKNSGIVTYEDGHIQEIKNFSYTTGEKGDIVSLTITDAINPQ